MSYYTQQQSTQPPPTKQQQKDNYIVDERWDSGDLFTTEQQSIKSHKPIEQLFKNMTLSAANTTEISPPLSTGSTKCKDELFTSCFREDIDEEDGYFSEEEEETDLNSFQININAATPITTPPISSVYEVVEQEQDCDYLTSTVALKDNNQHIPTTTYTSDDDDLLIESVSNQKEEQSTGPVSFDYYHSSLVQHYKSILFDLSTDEMLNNVHLPIIYKEYLIQVQQHMNSTL